MNFNAPLRHLAFQAVAPVDSRVDSREPVAFQGRRAFPSTWRLVLSAGLLLTVLISGTVAPALGQDKEWKEPEAWSKPFPGHRVIANLYAVGSYDLAVFLVTSEEGHILINTGVESSTAMIRENIESVGFRLEDVKVLLTMQAHWDHTAAFAEIKDLTGAKVFATEADARLLEDGGFSDAHFGGREMFKPVKVERILKDGDLVEVGTTSLKVVETPGHTEGSSSYTMVVSEGGRDYNVAIANMATINPGKKMVVDPTYPGVSEDFAMTFRKQKALDVDVWVAAHGSQYRLHKKYKAGQAYSPETFVDPEGYRAAVERLEGVYLKQVAEERGIDP